MRCCNDVLQNLDHCCVFNIANVGRRGTGGHFHRHGEKRILGEGVCAKAHPGKQMEVLHYGGDTHATVCLHVRAGERAERVAAGPQAGPGAIHVPTGLHW